MATTNKLDHQKNNILKINDKEICKGTKITIKRNKTDMNPVIKDYDFGSNGVKITKPITVTGKITFETQKACDEFMSQFSPSSDPVFTKEFYDIPFYCQAVRTHQQMNKDRGLLGSVNKRAFRKTKAGTVLFARMDGDLIGEKRYKGLIPNTIENKFLVRYSFKYREGGWNSNKIIDSTSGKIITSNLKIYSQNSFKRWESADLYLTPNLIIDKNGQAKEVSNKPAKLQKRKR